MTTGRKKHEHPPLAIPRTERLTKWISGKGIPGVSFREKGKHHAGNEGYVKDGRIYTYHPTKGWRSRTYK